MPNNSTNVSVPVKGMNTDVHPANLSEQGYDYALNAVVEDVTGNGLPLLQNEASTLPCANFPAGYKVIGFANIVEQDRKLLFLINPITGFGQIGEILGKSDCDDKLTDKDNQLGYCDSCEGGYYPEANPLEKQNITGCCEYFAIATQTCFNFSIDHPIKVVYRIEECGISVFFTDNNNPYRHIEFEYQNDDATQRLVVKDKYKLIVSFTPDCNAPVYGAQIDCNKLLINPVLTIPTIDLIDVISGGSLKAGTYQLLVSYADKNGDKRTPYFHATNPIPVFTRQVTFDTDYVTDKAIHVKIGNIDFSSPYEYFNIAVAKTINNVTSFEFVGTYPITVDSVVYSGNEKDLIKLDQNDIFQQKVYYAKSDVVATSGEYLFWGALEETKKINVQRIANNVKLYWQTMAVPEHIYRDPRNTNKFRGYMRDEVYAFGLVLIGDNGEEYGVGHIPGRASVTSDLDLINNPDVVKHGGCDDCVSDVVPPTQVYPSPLNLLEFTPSTSGITLNTENAVQAASCPLTAYSTSPDSPVDDGVHPVPVVNAGDDQTVNYYGSVTLSGSATALGGATIISTRWKQISGPNQVVINNPTLSSIYFDGYNAGTYVFQFIVKDSYNNISVDSVSVVVSIPVNQAPISDPGEDKIVALPNTSSYLNGANSSDDDGIKTYQWTQISGPNTATIVRSTFPYTDVTGLIIGTYVFKLTVTDIRGCISEATTKIYVVDDPSTGTLDNAKLLYPVNGAVTTASSSVVLDWEDVLYATSYDVYLRTDAGVFTLIGNTTDSSYVLTGLTPNTIYHWYVVPKNSGGSATGSDLYYRSFATPVEITTGNCEKTRWSVYNTATVLGGALEPYKDCEENCWQYGDFAYWESSEKYPNNPDIWGSLCGLPIRHHRFPDSVITHIHDGENGALDYSKNNYIFPIGVKVDHDSIRTAIAQAVTDGIITEEDSAKIKGYRIVRGNRFQHKSVVAKGLLYDMNHYKRKLDGDYFDNQPVYFANYPYNDVRSNPFITDDFRNYKTHDKEVGSDLPFIFDKRYTFHSPDTHFSEPTVGDRIKLETVEYGMSEGYFTKSKKQARQKFLSDTAYMLAFSGGIIAALTKTSPQEVKEYTAKGSVLSGMGVASGELGPYLPYQAGLGAATIVESVLDTLINPLKAGSINTATEVKTQTIQGKPSDYYNPIFLAAKKPWLLPLWPLFVGNMISSFLTTVITESKIILDMIEALTPYRDWCVQYNSVGKYNAYKTVPNTGSKIRNIDSWGYLKPENGYVSEPSQLDPTQYNSVKINNWHREAALYLRYTGVDFPNAGVFSTIQDQSRFTFEDAAVGKKLDKRVHKPISSYYASIKNYVPDQYGTVFNIDYLTTESSVFDINTPNSTCKTVYGGDTFINRFALKRKVPYFLVDTFQLADGTDFSFPDYVNLAVPRHYYDSTSGIGSEFDEIKDIFNLFSKSGIATFLGRPKSIRDGNTEKFFYQNGYIYLYHYGIPYFLVESDVNVDFRHAENLQEKAFYPLQSDLDYWLQEENVRLREPELFTYNSTYSKQNKEHAYNILPVDFQPGRDCRVYHPNRIIYSNGINWLNYKANDFYDLPLSSGQLIALDGIENDKVLVRTDDGAQVFNSYITIQTNTQDIAVGNGGMFQSKPQQYAETTLGYAGSQHSAILHTEFGHIWVDAKRGQVFNLSPQGLDEISKNGMRNWFKENLPFQVQKDFPNMSIDDINNAFKGVGLVLGFDKRFGRFLLTKLDYKCLDKTVTYDSNQKQFLKDGVVVKLTDNRYFCDRSWTISYNFYLQSWISFHSYNPNYYIDGVDYFSSGLNDSASSIWLHNTTNKSYQVVYGNLKPFTIQTISKADINKNTQNAVEFGLDAIRYHSEYDPFYTNDVTFNKAVVFNQNQNSGLLNLEYKTKKDLADLVSYPIAGVNNTTIRITNADGIWRFNQFYDIVQSRGNNIPLWINNCANSEKLLNNKALDYQMPDLDKRRIRGEYCRVRLTNDLHSNYKFVFKWLVNKSVKNYR